MTSLSRKADTKTFKYQAVTGIAGTCDWLIISIFRRPPLPYLGLDNYGAGRCVCITN